jgi:catechol 2,3-dioxygenase-like lactoylglutathione lyase family enzyme
MPMRRLAATLLSAFLFFHVVPLRAQLGPSNSSGVSIGHVHLTVRDPEQHKKLWGLLGAVVTHSGSLELLRFPGIYIVLTPGETTEGSEGSTVNHFGFAVKNVDDIHARLGAAGLPTVQELTNPKRWVTMFPDKIKIEFTEDPTLSVPIVGHHLHLSTTAANMETLRTWYVKTFGGIAETRRGFSSAVFNGGEINFLPANTPQASTKGRALDHIGFEVQGLDAFCKKLQAAGIMFETPYREVPQYGLKVAVITDPDGTRIELTEGLAGLRP